ncbi:glycosyltransferase family 4 protein [Microcystis elabens FACHB-917]|nr:glycosyltransferase family 4 protein [Microcystis elabens FACHB-917]
MKVLHVLSPGETSWGGGIPATLNGMAESPFLEWISFRQASLEAALETLHSWRPDVVIWHPACSWRGLPDQIRLIRTPSILVEHHYCNGFEICQVPYRSRFRMMLRLGYSLFDRVVSVSTGQASWMMDSRLLGASRLRVIPFSRTLEVFQRLPIGRSPHTPLRLGAFGRFVKQKGFDTLIKAIQILPLGSVQLLLGGDGLLESELRSLAAGHPGITFLGPITDVPAFLHGCDAIAIPSLWEPWGNVCLEARAAGLPVIVSSVGGLSEQMKGCGFAVPPASDTELADAIQQLIALSADERSRLADEARVSCLNSWDQFCRSWDSLLREFA